MSIQTKRTRLHLIKGIWFAVPRVLIVALLLQTPPLAWAQTVADLDTELDSKTVLRAETPLVSLIWQTLKSHPAVMGQEAQIQAATAGVAGAKWQFYPTPSVSAEQVNRNSNDDPLYPSYGGNRVITLRLQQPVWTGGRLTSGLRKAESTLAANEANAEDTRAQLALRVIQAYGDWLNAHLKLVTANNSYEAHTRLRAQVARRVDGGISPQSDLVLSDARQTQVRAEVIGAKALLDTALARLTQLVGRPISQAMMASRITAPLLLVGDGDALLNRALGVNYNLRRLNALADVSRAEIGEKQADLLPEVFVRAEHQNGSYNTVDSRPQSRLFVGVQSRFGAGLSSLSQVDAARARYQATLADVDVAKRALAEQVLSDWSAFQASHARQDALVAAMEASAAIQASWDRQFLAGRKTWLDVLNAARELAQAERDLAEVRSTRLVLSWRLAVTTDGLNQVLTLAEAAPASPEPSLASSRSMTQASL